MHAVHELDDSDSSGLFTGTVATSTKEKYPHQVLVNASVGPAKQEMQFKMDTGAEVNVLPSKYVDQIKGVRPLKPTKHKLYGYSGQALKLERKLKIECQHKGMSEHLEFYVLDTNAPAVLGLQSFLSLKLIELVLAINISPSKAIEAPMADSLFAEYADVFKGIGLFPGEYTIKLDENIQPVIHPPRKVALALQDKLKTELDRMERNHIITRVSDPTDWINSLAVVEKHNGDLGVCLDPRDLNKAIMREHYRLSTLEDITPIDISSL